jgi:NTE family protein
MLARSYRKIHPGNLADVEKGLTPNPLDFIFCSTDVVFGVNWMMRRESIGDYLLGRTRMDKVMEKGGFMVASAVAASSCFPPCFFPTSMRPKALPYNAPKGKYQPDEARNKWRKRIKLTDGGVYDNLGVEPLWKNGKYDLLVSDGGGPLPVASQSYVFQLIARYIAIIQNQAIGLRKRMLIGKFNNQELNGTYWGLSSVVKSYQDSATRRGLTTLPLQGYEPDFVKQWISPIRTDLSYFSPEEVGILINHGYSVADAAIQVHYSGRSSNPNAAFKWPFPGLVEPAAKPEDLREYLKRSDKLPIFPIFRSFRSRAWYFNRLSSYR